MLEFVVNLGTVSGNPELLFVQRSRKPGGGAYMDLSQSERGARRSVVMALGHAYFEAEISDVLKRPVNCPAGGC